MISKWGKHALFKDMDTSNCCFADMKPSQNATYDIEQYFSIDRGLL